MSAKGWAVVENGEIVVASVSDRRVEAIVNFLMTHRGVMIEDGCTDEEIEEAWRTYGRAAKTVAVTITLADH